MITQICHRRRAVVCENSVTYLTQVSPKQNSTCQFFSLLIHVEKCIHKLYKRVGGGLWLLQNYKQHNAIFSRHRQFRKQYKWHPFTHTEILIMNNYFIVNKLNICKYVNCPLRGYAACMLPCDFRREVRRQSSCAMSIIMCHLRVCAAIARCN